MQYRTWVRDIHGRTWFGRAEHRTPQQVDDLEQVFRNITEYVMIELGLTDNTSYHIKVEHIVAIWQERAV